MTRKTILKKLQELSFNELKNLNNALTTDGYTSIWYYTYQELYDLYFKGRIEDFLQKLAKDSVNVNKKWVYYDPYIYPRVLRSIRECDLVDLLENNIEDYANILYKNQKYYYLEEIFNRWTQDK